MYYSTLFITVLCVRNVLYCTVTFSSILYITVLTVMYWSTCVLHCIPMFCTVMYCSLLYISVLYCKWYIVLLKEQDLVSIFKISISIWAVIHNVCDLRPNQNKKEMFSCNVDRSTLAWIGWYIVRYHGLMVFLWGHFDLSTFALICTAKMPECEVTKAKLRRCDTNIASSPSQLQTFAFATSHFEKCQKLYWKG